MSNKNAKLETNYNEIPYESYTFVQSHPDRLATIGKLFGMIPAPVTKCRVLELGCASGGNLIPMAFNLPESEFIGVDFSAKEVEMGNKIIKDLNLKNIRLEQLSIMDIDETFGKFDYIICHDVYSSVPSIVQYKIILICSLSLTPQGIAYISYNTYPVYFYQFMEKADSHDLQYLGDAEFSTMLPNTFQEDAIKSLKSISNNIIESEQYMDFLKNRSFRRTLLCHNDVQLNRNLDKNNLNGFLISSEAQPVEEEISLSQDKSYIFKTSDGSSIETNHPVTKASLMVLRELWPRAIDMDTLYKEVFMRLKIPQSDEQNFRDILVRDLLKCYSCKLVELHTWQPDYITKASEKPKVNNLVSIIAVKEPQIPNK